MPGRSSSSHIASRLTGYWVEGERVGGEQMEQMEQGEETSLADLVDGLPRCQQLVLPALCKGTTLLGRADSMLYAR